MTSQTPLDQDQAECLRRAIERSDKAQFRYGAGCALSNGLFFLAGAFDDKPWMFAGAGVSLLAQLANMTWRDAAKPYTSWIIVGSGPLFITQGFQSHNLGYEVYGAFKTVGKAQLFWGAKLGKRMHQSPALRRLGGVMARHGGLIAEGLLFVGSLGLGSSGVIEAIHGFDMGHWAEFAKGGAIVAGTLAFIAGNRARSSVPHVSAEARKAFGPRATSLRAPSCD